MYQPKFRAQSSTTKVLLYRVVGKGEGERARKEGIHWSKSACLEKDETEPRRNTAVFAYTLETLKRIARYFEQADDEVIVFEVDPKGWLCGDLKLECSSAYTVIPFEEFLENPWLHYFEEMEVFLPNGHVSPDQIVEIKKRMEFV